MRKGKIKFEFKRRNKGGDENGRKNSYNHSARPRDAGAKEKTLSVFWIEK